MKTYFEMNENGNNSIPRMDYALWNAVKAVLQCGDWGKSILFITMKKEKEKNMKSKYSFFILRS